jgi:superfamily I DNA/RNA helicase
MVFSKYQEAIFDFVANGTGHGIINAVAGSGKTSTILEALKLTSGRVLFLAFGKAIATELQRRVPANVKASTLHSAGYSLITNVNRVKVDAFKVDGIMDNYQPLAVLPSLKGAEKSAVYEARKVVKEMVKLIKNTLTDYTDTAALLDLADYYDVDLESKHFPMIEYVVERSNTISNWVIDFDDQIYIPVINKLKPLDEYDFIFIDESQDLNRCQIELALRLAGNGRIICVGDPKQSIYGFRGADIGAMERIQKALNAKEFPLSVCYRCPTSHLDKAREIVPQIEAAPNAKSGEIISITDDKFIDTLTKEDATKTITICRTNAELVSYALSMIGKGQKVIVKGKKIGEGLISLVKKMQAYTTAELYLKLDNWKTKEINKHIDRRNAETVIQHINDKYDTLMAVIKGCDSVYCVTSKLENLFKDNATSGYIFSSIHQAKGLEADIIYILAPHKLPLVWKGQQPWEAEQEMNIRYVAITRSKNKIVWVNKKDK